MSQARTSSTWVIASGNEGKLSELRTLLDGSGLTLVAQRELGIVAAEETGATFVENAILKARHAARAATLPAIADDSGLVVEALDGAPGIRSARFAGAGADDAANVRKLLEVMADLDDEQRAARFHCTMVAMRHADDPAPLIASAQWRGSIARSPRGTRGFGYDPVFVDAERGSTAAELDPATKNRISHRGRALQALVRMLLATR